MKNELYNGLSGKSQVRFGATIQAITGYLTDGAQSSKAAKDTKYFKKQETERLEYFVNSHNT